MEFRITLLILLPLGLAAAAILRYGVLPAWRRAVERCDTMDERDAREKASREEAERELQGDTPQ